MGPVMFITGNELLRAQLRNLPTCFNGAGDVHHRKRGVPIMSVTKPAPLQWGR